MQARQMTPPFPIDSTSWQSPNTSTRSGRPIGMIVLHATAGPARSSLDWLCSPSSHVSTHYLLTKSGALFQLVDDSLAAWHAGASAWNSLDSAAIQAASLGIELENANDGHDPYPPAQLDALTWLARQKIMQYRISREMVVRHLDIAIPAGRKTDPAGFPWNTWLNALYAPTDPLRARTIAGPRNSVKYCGTGFFDAYHATGRGPALLGLALGDETRDGDVTFMRLERAILKHSAQYGVELALLAEARDRGWL